MVCIIDSMHHWYNSGFSYFRIYVNMTSIVIVIDLIPEERGSY